MSRSNYSDDLDTLELGRWRGQVASSLRGKRGQAFLRELADAMDAMPEKRLITGKLISEFGECCTIGVVCKARKLDVDDIDITDPEDIGRLVDIARPMAAEIVYLNDEVGVSYRFDPEKGYYVYVDETPEARWLRIRKWVTQMITP